MHLMDNLNTYHQLLHRLFDDCRQAVVLTGAGISTESGIPDFRSPGGIWSKYRIIEYGEFITSEEARQHDWQRRFDMEDQFGSAEPNAGHEALANLVRRGVITHVITQNIDALHQKSGVPAEKVIELHGNATRAHCVACELVHDLDAIRADFEETGQSPRCVSCGAIVKNSVIMFGEQMPEDAMRAAERASLEADLFIAIGTSLVVHPAAGLPLLAKRNGATLVILNREETELDRFADHTIHAGIGEVLEPFAG